ncbi:ATP-binding protein [Oligoflexia bacterium]|nr:ATP-binding protein [Oligoflexia bacterium]
MIERLLKANLLKSLNSFPVVALLGSRQVGKTTLAHALLKNIQHDSVYLDLEKDSDRSKLEQAELYLNQHQGKLVIIDEVQRQPELFPLLRSIVDERIRQGQKYGHFLVLGSASRDLLRQSSETLAGRIAYLELSPFALKEIANERTEEVKDQLWRRGGYPDSFLAHDEELSYQWRQNFISTYLERDIPQLGIEISSEFMRRLWTMLAHHQGDTLNLSKFAGSLGLAVNSVKRYIDILTDLYMLRQLPPWAGNTKKRLVKTPKVYLRDTGLLHALLRITDQEALFGHTCCGYSWEGFIIEQIMLAIPDTYQCSFYRTSTQVEIDLVLEGPMNKVMAIEIKRSLNPKVTKGFRSGCEEIKATDRFYVAPVNEAYPLDNSTLVLPITDLVSKLQHASDIVSQNK